MKEIIVKDASGRPLRLYAQQGEMVYYERGHAIGRITRDIVWGEASRGDEIEGIAAKPDQCFPRCRRCGAFFTKASQYGHGGFIFAEDMR